MAFVWLISTMLLSTVIVIFTDTHWLMAGLVSGLVSWGVIAATKNFIEDLSR